MFGVGGLFATQVLDLHGGQAAIVGVAFGLVGMGIAYGLFAFSGAPRSEEPFSMRDLVGDTAFVSVGDPGRATTAAFCVKKEGQTHEFSATRRGSDIAVGTHRPGDSASPRNGLIVDTPISEDKRSTVPDIFDWIGGGVIPIFLVIIVVVLIVSYIGSRYKVAGGQRGADRQRPARHGPDGRRA